MGASTAAVLSFKSISKDILRHISLLLTILGLRVFMAFQELLLLEYVVVLKRTETFVFVVGLYAPLSPDSSCQLNIFRHDGNSPGMDGTQVGIVKQPDKVCLCCFLETQYRRRLESQICLVVLGDLPHQPLEGQLSDEQRRAPLEVTDVLQSHSPCSVSVGFY